MNNWNVKIRSKFVKRSGGIAGVSLIAIAYRLLMQQIVKKEVLFEDLLDRSSRLLVQLNFRACRNLFNPWAAIFPGR